MTSRSDGVLSGMASFRGVNDILELTAIITAMGPTCMSTFFDATSKNKTAGSTGRRLVWSEVAGRAIACIAIHGSVGKSYHLLKYFLWSVKCNIDFERVFMDTNCKGPPLMTHGMVVTNQEFSWFHTCHMHENGGSIREVVGTA